jgi:hypothetical protein
MYVETLLYQKANNMHVMAGVTFWLLGSGPKRRASFVSILSIADSYREGAP